MSNADKFINELSAAYKVLFKLPDYAMAAKRYEPWDLAEKMAKGLVDGSANKDGDGIRIACKTLGIKHTYAAIREYMVKE